MKNNEPLSDPNGYTNFSKLLIPNWSSMPSDYTKSLIPYVRASITTKRITEITGSVILLKETPIMTDAVKIDRPITHENYLTVAFKHSIAPTAGPVR